MLDKTMQGRRDVADPIAGPSPNILRQVVQALRQMDAVANFGQRPDRDSSVSQANCSRFRGKSFGEICRDGIRGTTQLLRQFVSLRGRQLFAGHTIDLDTKIIGALPGDQLLMWL